MDLCIPCATQSGLACIASASVHQPPGCNCSLSTMHHSTMHHSTMKSEMKMFKCDFLFKQPPYYTSLFSDCVFQNGLVVLSSVSQRQGLGTIWYNWKHTWEYCMWTVLTVIERTEKLAAETPLPGNAQVWITKETRGGEYFMVMNQPSARKEPDIWPIIIFQTLDHIPDIWPIIIPDTWPYSRHLTICQTSSNHPIIMILADSKLNSDDQSKSVAAVRSGTEHGKNGKSWWKVVTQRQLQGSDIWPICGLPQMDGKYTKHSRLRDKTWNKRSGVHTAQVGGAQARPWHLTKSSVSPQISPLALSYNNLSEW